MRLGFLSIFDQILAAIKANGQKQDLTNEKLDKLIELMTASPTKLEVKLGPPVKR